MAATGSDESVGQGKAEPAISAQKAGEPTRMSRPSARASTPAPATARMSVASRTGPPGGRAFTRACAIGWDRADSRDAARVRQAARSRSPSTSTSRRCMRPVVSVPVLSKTRCVAEASASMARPLVTMTPRRDSAFTQAVSATGVASDRAQGHVTTSVETATHRAFEGSIHHHASAPRAARATTAITKWLARRSATRAQRGFCEAARSIWRRITSSVASPAARSTRVVTGEARLMLPARTLSPAAFGTG